MERKRRLYQSILLFAAAALYALLYSFCSQIDEGGRTIAGEAFFRFVKALPIAWVILSGMFKYVLPKAESIQREPEKPFCVWKAFILIFACYLPLFLIHYPGSFQYDTATEVAQIAGGHYNQMHPVLHTLLVRFCLWMYWLLQSFEKCAALLNLIQMTIVSLCFALICASISRSVSRLAARISLLFFCLHPSHWAFASNCTKDVLFSAFLALFFALCMEEIRTGGISRKRHVLRMISGVLAMLLRNNLIFAFVLWAAVLLFFGKKYRKMVLYMILIIVLGQGINTVLISLVNAKDGRITEGLSLPIQQMARVVLSSPECLTREERALLDELFVSEEASETPGAPYIWYNPMLADPVKNNVNHGKIAENLGDFFGLWFNIGRKAPREYLDAFLNLALPSLYPYREYRLPARYIEVGCNLSMTVFFGQPPIVQPRRFADERIWLDETLYLTGADENGILRWLFNTGFTYWLMLMLFLYDLYKGRWQCAAVMMLPVLFWLLYLLGPIMQGRYLYPFLCMLPAMFFRTRTDT